MIGLFVIMRTSNNLTTIVLKLLIFEQNQLRMAVTHEMLTTFNDEPDLITKVIAGDESWVYVYGIESKAESSRFFTIEEIKEISKQNLLMIPKSGFQNCFENWKKRWYKFIISEGGYFKGDRIVSDK